MRKLSLIPYQFNGTDYDVKGSLSSILFSQHLKLGARQVIEHDRIASKIEGGNGSVLLEEADYQTLKTAVETFEGYSRPDIEFVQRVLDAPTVEVVEGY